MKRDFRTEKEYIEVENTLKSIFEPGFGKVTAAKDINACKNKPLCAYSGIFYTKLEGRPYSNIYMLDIKTRNTIQISDGLNHDYLPKFSPDGKFIAYLTDKIQHGVFQTCVCNIENVYERYYLSVANATIEDFSWSQDCKRLLFIAAGFGADTAGRDGATTTYLPDEEMPDWMPETNSHNEQNKWRRLWIYDLEKAEMKCCSAGGLNIWLADWCGDNRIVALASCEPGEDAWYKSKIEMIDIEAETNYTIYKPLMQVGSLTASPCGKHIAFVECYSSDRNVVFGGVKVINTDTGYITDINTNNADIAYLRWRSDESFVYAADRSFQTVIGEYFVHTNRSVELFVSDKVFSGFMNPEVAAYDLNQCLLITESFTTPPAVSIIAEGKCEPLVNFSNEGSDKVKEIIGNVSQVTWKAPDGNTIEGWLIEPKKERPHPVIMSIHGGPVWANRNYWLVNSRPTYIAFLKAGYAIFFPNPRGSVGRGEDFVKWVYGDMGGLDTFDFISGAEHLVNEGIAIKGKIGITGVSYGGYMTNWLVTQDQRFAAAVAISPISDWFSFYYTANVPKFSEEFLNDSPTNACGKFYQRSPVFLANKVKTPTLIVTGSLDRITPPTQAYEFHNAIKEHGGISTLVVYPKEGHSVRDMQSAVDLGARMLYWFKKYMA